MGKLLVASVAPELASHARIRNRLSWGLHPQQRGLRVIFWMALMVLAVGKAWAATDHVVVSVAGGGDASCARLDDGTVRCWGNNNGGRLGISGGGHLPVPVVHPGLAAGSVRALAIGDSHACALMLEGTVRCWGAGAQGQLGNGGTASSLVPVTVTGLTDVVALDTGTDTNCAVRANGQVFCWGRNSTYGILGDGSTGGQSATPVQVATIDTAISVAVGNVHACALLQGGTARCWGDNANGQLGTGTSGSATSSPTPVDVTGLNDAVELVVAPGSDHSHSCARRGDGAVLCWGRNYSGQIGNGQHGGTGGQWIHASTPTLVAGLGGAAQQVVVGSQFSCALRDDGRVLCWGDDSDGVIGYDSRDHSISATPALRDNPTGIVRLMAAGGHACALDEEARLHCWGNRTTGQLGDGSLGYATVPSPAQELDNIRSLSTGSRPFSCAATEIGQVHCWGLNENDVLSAGPARAKTTPGAPVSAVSGAQSVSVGGNHFCALLTSGQVSCWGRNERGQLGRSHSFLESPAIIAGLGQVTRVALGWQHSCALHSTGKVSCWGLNSSGQLGRGSTSTDSPIPAHVVGIDDAVALAAGESHTCAVLGNGDMYCWGSNSSKQFDAAAPGVVSTPIRVFQGADDVGTGRFHTCALTDQATVSCWGGNSATVRGQLGGLTNVVALSSAYNHNCVVLHGGSVRCWGENRSGQLGNSSIVDSALPVPVDGLVDVASLSAGHGDSCALLHDGTAACWGSNSWGRLGNGQRHYSPQAVEVVFDPGAAFNVFSDGFETRSPPQGAPSPTHPDPLHRVP